MSDTYVNSSNLSRFWTNAKTYIDNQKDELFVTAVSAWNGTSFVWTVSHTFAQIKAAITAGRTVIVSIDDIKDASASPVHHYLCLAQLQTNGDTVLIFNGTAAYNGYVYSMLFSMLNDDSCSLLYNELVSPPSPVYTQAEKTALTNLSFDTGWVSLKTYAASSVTPDSVDFMARRVGYVVHIRINATATTTLTKNAWQTIASGIPDEFRPDYNAICVMDSSFTQADHARMRVEPNGTISVYRRGTDIPSGQWFRVDFTYTVDGALIPEEE